MVDDQWCPMTMPADTENEHVQNGLANFKQM